MIVDDHEISICQQSMNQMHCLTEPESESIAYWRAERLAREEFIEVWFTFSYMYMYVCWGCESG